MRNTISYYLRLQQTLEAVPAKIRISQAAW